MVGRGPSQIRVGFAEVVTRVWRAGVSGYAIDCSYPRGKHAFLQR